jgi:hypothetical protein
VTSIQPLMRIPVGVVIERRETGGVWGQVVWRPIAVLPGVPNAEPWTTLAVDAKRTEFYGGTAEIELHRSGAGGYRENLATGAALLWVVVRPTGDEHRAREIVAVTADPGEGEAFLESAPGLVETVPMPEPVRAAIAEFVARHYVDQKFVKRERDRADPEILSRRAALKNGK